MGQIKILFTEPNISESTQGVKPSRHVTYFLVTQGYFVSFTQDTAIAAILAATLTFLKRCMIGCIEQAIINT